MSRPSEAILTVNCGSSSIKFALYPCLDDGVGSASLWGQIEGMQAGAQTSICIKTAGADEDLRLDLQPGASFTQVLSQLRSVIATYTVDLQLKAVAHRVVHGGARYAQSIAVDQTVLAYLQTLETLAPLHQGHNLAGIRAFQQAYPGVVQVACFDTGFHTDLPEIEKLLPLSLALRESGIRRYGFHGLSYRYLAARLRERSAQANGRVLMAHLGNGASLCGMFNGKSVATSMGFSALDGLMMGSRCGALDPGVLLHLLGQGWDLKRLEHTLYKESGLLGVSGISADMRTLRASNAPAAALAIELFTHRLVRECGALVACMGGIDALVFSGGIGEHDALLRQQTCAALAYLGLCIDPALNQAATGEQVMSIHAAASATEIWVIPTDEGSVAAQDAAEILRQKI